MLKCRIGKYRMGAFGNHFPWGRVRYLSQRFSYGVAGVVRAGGSPPTPDTAQNRKHGFGCHFYRHRPCAEPEHVESIFTAAT